MHTCIKHADRHKQIHTHRYWHNSFANLTSLLHSTTLVLAPWSLRLFVTGESMTTSRRSSVMFSQSHSASSTSSAAYSSFYHFTELFQSTCAIAALGLIPPRPGYGYDHWMRTHFGDRAFVNFLPPVLDVGTRGRDLGGTGGRSPQNLKWWTAHALVPPIF